MANVDVDDIYDLVEAEVEIDGATDVSAEFEDAIESEGSDS